MLKKKHAHAFGAAFGPLGLSMLRASLMLCACLFCCVLVFWCLQNSSLAVTVDIPEITIRTSKQSEKKPETPRPIYPPNRLFGSVEFRTSIKNMPKWERVLNKYADRKSLDADFSKAQLAEWTKFIGETARMPAIEKIKAVNTFFNRWPYRGDPDIYGLVDYWATPAEFIKNSGDCEDYAIVKFFALIQLGLDPLKMRVVVIKDLIRNFEHAVLAVYLGDDVYILDNNSSLVLSHNKYSFYKPLLSFNLSYRWAHLPPVK